MTNIIRKGQGILFMKVGTHAKESLNDIIARKTKEIEAAGYTMWGYGGGTCHPGTMVQPFAKDFAKAGNVIYLCMQEMDSKHFAEQIPADEYSADGQEWKPVPNSIKVLGSRYALTIKNLRKEQFVLHTGHTKVAVGNSSGMLGSKYIKGRVDKACLEITGEPPSTNTEERAPIQIGLVADLIEPYAVFLRNKPGR